MGYQGLEASDEVNELTVAAIWWEQDSGDQEPGGVLNVSAVVCSAQQRSSQMSKKKAAGNQVGQVPSPSLLQEGHICYLEATR